MNQDRDASHLMYRRSIRSVRKSIIIAFTCIMLADGFPALAAGSSYTPPQGSHERRAIMDALRPSVENEYKPPVMFKVDSLRVVQNWASAHVSVLRPNGRPIQAMLAGGYGPAYVMAVLAKGRTGSWRIVRIWFNPSDVAECELEDVAPKGLMDCG